MASVGGQLRQRPDRHHDRRGYPALDSHQIPLLYEGTGTTKSRMIHALRTPFICKGDNGRWQPDCSSLGGYVRLWRHLQRLLSGVNRGPGLVFSTALVDVGASMANGLIQEFVLRKLTPSAKTQPRLEAGGN